LDQGIFCYTICCVKPLFTNAYENPMFAIGPFEPK